MLACSLQGRKWLQERPVWEPGLSTRVLLSLAALHAETWPQCGSSEDKVCLGRQPLLCKASAPCEVITRGSGGGNHFSDTARYGTLFSPASSSLLGFMFSFMIHFGLVLYKMLGVSQIDLSACLSTYLSILSLSPVSICNYLWLYTCIYLHLNAQSSSTIC